MHIGNVFLDSSDIAAYIIICGCLGLLFCGFDGEIKSILAIAAGWAFRRPIVNGVSTINKNKKSCIKEE